MLTFTRRTMCNCSLGDGAKKITGRILRSANVQDHNTFEKPEAVKPVEFNGAKIEGGIVKLTLPACSVVVLSINMKNRVSTY